MKKTTIIVTGMHCASCSTLIDRSLKKVEGVKSSNVNLTTNKATVEFDEKKVKVNELIQTIKNKGYGAKEGSVQHEHSDVESVRFRFYISLFFSIPVFILGMFFMKNPLPFQNYWMWILSTPVQFYIAYPMYKSAFRALKGFSANMDTLIVMGTSAAYFYSAFTTLTGGMHVYFEASAVLITIVIFGRLLEAKARGKTSDAIKKLIGLKPKKATVIRNGKEIKISKTVSVRPKISLFFTDLSPSEFLYSSLYKYHNMV